MKPTGVIRRIDDLGRVIIPKDIRRRLFIKEGDPLEIFTEDDMVIYRKYKPINEIESAIAETKSRVRDCTDIPAENAVKILQMLTDVEELF